MLRLKELRMQKNLSQVKIAEFLGCNQTAVGKYERGQLEPSLETLKKLSNFFECSVGYLIGVENESGNVINQNFTQEELQLIENFRAMDKTQKNAILVTARNFAGKNKAESFSAN